MPCRVWDHRTNGSDYPLLRPPDNLSSVLSSVYARKAIVEQNDRSAYIATIVFGALINEIALAGAIVGLIAYRNDYPKADVIDVESK